ASGLINIGLSADQVEQIAQDVFQFNPKAATAIINQSSITPAPHDPNTDIGFSVNFTIAIDGTNYAAVASYTDINNVTLQLSNPSTGSVLYDSSTGQQTGGD